MKLIFILFVLTLAFKVFAQETAPAIAEEIAPSSSESLNIGLKSNLLYMLNGMWNLDLDIALTDNFTLGPTFLYYKAGHESSIIINGKTVDSSSSKMTAASVGVRASWYVNGVKSKNTWVLSPYFNILPTYVSGQSNGDLASQFFYSQEIGLLVTFRKIWKYGFNYTFGGGLGFLKNYPEDIVSGKTTVTAASPGIFGVVPHLDASVGWIF